MGGRMNNYVEHGCAECGAEILKPAAAPLDAFAPPRPPANQCDECGHVTNMFEMAGFQCSGRIYSWISHHCTSDELKRLRLDPSSFLGSTLNARRIAANKPVLEIDATTKPPTILEK
jgi:hypothetical protein